jgi:hypothetical protein
VDPLDKEVRLPRLAMSVEVYKRDATRSEWLLLASFFDLDAAGEFLATRRGHVGLYIGSTWSEMLIVNSRVDFITPQI